MMHIHTGYLSRRGFTLIELLVVIAIIGILSAVILASLSTARAKGNYASVLQQMQELQNAAYIASGNYSCGSYSSIYPCDVGPNTLPTGLSIGSFPSPPCSGWAYDWENWNGGNLIRITLRRTNMSSVFYWCINDTTGGDCSNGGDGTDILLYTPKTITCNE